MSLAAKATNWYEHSLARYPKLVLLVISCLLAYFACYMPDFKLDASADSLVLENDKDLRYYRIISERYGGEDYLVLIYTPKHDLFSEASLSSLKKLRDELNDLASVDKVRTILDVPLLQGPRVTIMNFGAKIRYLEDPETHKEDARHELINSPLYRNLLISEDGRTTALLIQLKVNEDYKHLLKERDALRAAKYERGLTSDEQYRLDQVSHAFHEQNAAFVEAQRAQVKQVRQVILPYYATGSLFLGGVPMIASDMIDYVENDIIVFGVGVFLFMVATLWLIFRKTRWVILPLLCCMGSCIIMVGYLGYADWRATVISSNFISLLLIFTLSLNIHLIVSYRELHKEFPDMNQRELVGKTVERMFVPCLYTALTTMVAFISLLVSGIRPVIDFGQMMVIGISVSFILSFVLFPAEVMLLNKASIELRGHAKPAFTRHFADLVTHHGNKVLWVFGIVVIITAVGMTQLSVENRFIDYFKKHTEIYQGMKEIDQRMGGTTPLDIIIDGDGPDYWFYPYQVAELKSIHEFIESLPETGKVLSYATFIKMAEGLNENKPLNSFFMTLMRENLSGSEVEPIVTPYVTKDYDEVRLSVRVRESDTNLRRHLFLEGLRKDLVEKFDVTNEQLHLTGMLVLYNNMLQSLFKSQILTLGTVLAIIMLMFLLLFRSIKISLIGIIPNMISVLLVLGIMGLLKIPLDMMTITIAAISVGIAVDDTIHYIHRFEREFAKRKNYREVLYICHTTIGRAMLYTSITVVIGFSILTLSNFIPTIYFGIFTGIAMIAAILAALTLLPKLILMFKPFGPEEPQ